MQRTIIILGMHRSGTSALTGALQQAGVYLGDVAESAPHNKKGTRESRTIMHLQEDLLRSSGGSWFDPPDQVRWRWRHRRVRKRFIRGFAGRPIWGFKDPRTLFTLDGWLDALPDAEPVGIFRHPVLTAQSLERRNELPLEFGMSLWRRYNERLLRHHRRRAFPVVCFDAADFNESLDALGRRLSLPGARTGTPFFEDGLRHNELPRDVAVPESVSALYDELCSIAS